MRDPGLKEVERLLAAEREAIMSGAYDRLADLAPRKTDLIEGLAGRALPETALRRVARAVKRNQDLLAAALTGLREAAGRLLGDDKPATFQAYGSDGQRATLRSTPPSFERKA